MTKYNNYKKAEIKPYQQLIKKLIYLLHHIKPDIAFAIKQLDKYNSDFKISHIKVAKKIVYYLKSNIHLKITYKA